jgi:hypothetical protein
MAGIHLRPEANDLGGAALELPPNPELENAEAEYGSIGPCANVTRLLACEIKKFKKKKHAAHPER